MYIYNDYPNELFVTLLYCWNLYNCRHVATHVFGCRVITNFGDKIVERRKSNEWRVITECISSCSFIDQVLFSSSFVVVNNNIERRDQWPPTNKDMLLSAERTTNEYARIFVFTHQSAPLFEPVGPLGDMFLEQPKEQRFTHLAHRRRMDASCVAGGHLAACSGGCCGFVVAVYGCLRCGCLFVMPMVNDEG